MSETIDSSATFRAAYKKLREDISAVVDRAAGHGVPDTLIADQLLFVSLRMMLHFIEMGAPDYDVGIFARIPAKFFWGRERIKGPLTLIPQMRPAGGDKVSPLAKVAAVGTATRQAREELLAIGNNGVGTFFCRELCNPLLEWACYVGTRQDDDGLTVSNWAKVTENLVHRFEAGELRSDEELLDKVANRSVSVGGRTVVERNLQS